jgi:hypothetical protein
MHHDETRQHRHDGDDGPARTGPVLAGILAFAALLLVAGIRQELPHAPEADEPFFLAPAVRMASNWDPNPGWFGQPGSTVIYPLAVLAHLWHGLTRGGRLLGPDPRLVASYLAQPDQLVMLGRLLSMGYALAALVLVYVVGRRAFGRRVGLAGAAITAVLPMSVWYAQLVRPDSAATALSLLALWRCLVLLDGPSVTPDTAGASRRASGEARNQLLAGAAIGLAVSSRYFMLALLPALAVVDLVRLTRGRSRGVPAGKAALGTLAIGPLAALAAFALTTPFLVMDLGRAIPSLLFEARTAHLGADGLSPLGNLLWYAQHGLAEAMTWPLVVLAALGIGRALLGLRRPGGPSAGRAAGRAAVDPRSAAPPGSPGSPDPAAPLVLLAFVLALVVLISLPALHWARWLIQALPVLALFAADAVLAAADGLAGRLRSGPRARRAILAAGLAAALGTALWQVAWTDLRLARPSTRQQARAWLLSNLPAGSRVGLEWWTAPFFPDDFLGFVAEPRRVSPPGSGLELIGRPRLVDGGGVADYRREGYDYLVTSDNWVLPAMAAPERAPELAAFYRELFGLGPPVADFVPGPTRGGPRVRVFRLPAGDAAGPPTSAAEPSR